jgi:hypothetical protein
VAIEAFMSVMLSSRTQKELETMDAEIIVSIMGQDET